MGEIYAITVFVEKRKSPFAVSRLIMMSGVNVREYDQYSVDDPEHLVRVRNAVQYLLTPEELNELIEQLAAATD